MSTIVKTDKTFDEIAKELEQIEKNVSSEGLDVKYNPNVIERELIEEELNKEQDPKDIAKLALEIYYPELLRMLKEFHARELRDLIKCIVEFPYHTRHLEDKNTKFKQAVSISNFIIDAKFTLMASGFFDAIDETNNTNTTTEVKNGE